MRVAAHLSRGAAAGLSSAVLLGLLAWAAPAAHATRMPQATQTARAARPGHLIRPDTGIAATNANGGLYYFWQAAGSTKWHKETVAAPDTAPGYDYYTPALVSAGGDGVGMAVYGDDMVIVGSVPSAYTDANTVWYWTQVPGSG
jgi:hypothetical protein